ncbi:hypothetical protein PtrSN002B_012183 [Pyrenophora tritici-repentis]|nr:hypothetical protein PtrSN002B_012183 [Pyrenophora tritici-repentis]
MQAVPTPGMYGSVRVAGKPWSSPSFKAGPGSGAHRPVTPMFRGFAAAEKPSEKCIEGTHVAAAAAGSGGVAEEQQKPEEDTRHTTELGDVNAVPATPVVEPTADTVVKEAPLPEDSFCTRMESRLCDLVRRADADEARELSDLMVETKQNAPRGASAEDVASLYTAAVVCKIGEFRGHLRAECKRHEWIRRRDPLEVADGEDYDSCPQCNWMCGSSEEERGAFIRAEEVKFKLKMERMREASRGGNFCCLYE